MNEKDPDCDPRLKRKRLFTRAVRQAGLQIMNAVVLTMEESMIQTDDNQTIGDHTAESIRNLFTPEAVEQLVRFVHYTLGTKYTAPN